MTNSQYHIDHTYIGNPDAINDRVSRLPESDREAIGHVLRYLYLNDGPTTVPRSAKPIAERHLSDTEHVVFPWLYKRTDGKLRRLYGVKALEAVKNSDYKCARCGYGDVRALHIEKAEFDEETKIQHFVCVCANCNTIGAREKEMMILASKQKSAESQAEQNANHDAS